MANGSQLTSQTSNFKTVAIIVAGGSGTRMQSALPKQFMLLKGKPVILHTIEAFANSSYQPQIIVVLPQTYHEYWNNLCLEYQFNHPHLLIGGGATRFHSVKNALDVLPEEDLLVTIHDAVRPMIDPALIDACYQQAASLGNAVAAVKSRDSVRRLKNDMSESLLRDEIYLVQTPQTFKLQQLTDAYTLPYTEAFTDDASVVEQAGYPINLAEGSYSNFKITYPDDLLIAETLMNKKELP